MVELQEAGSSFQLSRKTSEGMYFHSDLEISNALHALFKFSAIQMDLTIIVIIIIIISLSNRDKRVHFLCLFLSFMLLK